LHKNRILQSIKSNYVHTLYACYAGYITQAIVVNFAPLLFLTFNTNYRISLDRITLLITVNFLVQLLVDLASAKFAYRIGYRPLAIAAHICAAVGLAGLGILPLLFGDPYAGLLIAVVVYAVGGGLIEVLISPIVEACPTEKKSASMSLLHSFYSWGQVFVILASTLFFVTLGIRRWQILAVLWALIPLLNAFYFFLVPIATLEEQHGSVSIKKLLSMKIFWMFTLLMICSGASEIAMSQWASAFAESGLKVAKTVGDLIGPCLFAAFMGITRTLYAKYSAKIHLRTFMVFSGLMGLVCYLLASLSPYPALALAGCALCGVAVGILWPGTLSLAAANCPAGGAAMFALLALAGDLGCSLGPTVVGLVSGSAGENLKSGLLAGVIFPILMIVTLLVYRRRVKG